MSHVICISALEVPINESERNASFKWSFQKETSLPSPHCLPQLNIAVLSSPGYKEVWLERWYSQAH